jgi:hypothetical protein
MSHSPPNENENDKQQHERKRSQVLKALIHPIQLPSVPLLHVSKSVIALVPNTLVLFLKPVTTLAIGRNDPLLARDLLLEAARDVHIRAADGAAALGLDPSVQARRVELVPASRGGDEIAHADGALVHWILLWDAGCIYMLKSYTP